MGSQINSRSSSRHFHLEEEPIENRRLQVQIGRVLDMSSLPWSFRAKTDYPRQPPIKCQLARAAELPVAAHFESVAEDQHGEFEMIVLATHQNRMRSVNLFFKDSGCDVAKFLEDEHLKRQINLSSRLPQFKRFIDPESTPTAGSSCSSGGHFEQLDVGTNTNDTYTSHRGPIYAPGNQLTGYVKNQSKSLPKTWQPDMKSGSQLNLVPSAEKLMLSGGVAGNSCLSDSSESGTQMFHQQLPPTPKPSRQNVASKPSAPSCVPTIHKFTFPQPKSQATGIVTYFKSHSHFFFRVEFPTFDLLEKRLQNKYSKMPFKKIPLRGNKSAYAACLHNRWHRAEFLSTVTGSRAKVLLVDKGKSYDVPLTNLRLLDKEDAEVPVKTVCCALRGVMLGERNDLNGPIEEVMGQQIEARFVSIISVNKYSTILTKGDGLVVNCMMGSDCFDSLKRKVSAIECLEMIEGEEYEVKLVGPVRDKVQHVQLKDSMANLCGIGAQLREIEKSQVSHVPSVGDYVFLFENPYLRRGRITCITENSREAYLIDLGVTKDVTDAYIQLLPEHYWLLPAMAVRCVNRDWGETSWPKQDEYFKVTVCGFEKNLPVLKMLKTHGTDTMTRSSSKNNRSSTRRIEADFQPSTRSVDSSTTAASFLPSSKPHRSPQAATVTCVHSASMYSVQLDAKKKMLADMEAEIKRQNLRPVIVPLKVGQVCLAISNGRWLRAEVLPDGQALFFDYGHRQPLVGNGMQLEKHLEDIEPGAVICRAPPHLGDLTEGDSVLVQLCSAEGNRIVALSSEEKTSDVHESSPSEARQNALVGNFCPPWTVWLVRELDVLHEISSRLENQPESALIKKTDSFKLRELYACKTAKGWFRGRLDKLNPLKAFLIDYGQEEHDLLQLVPLSGLNKIVPPLAAPLQIFNGDLESRRVEAKLIGLLKQRTKVEALVDSTNGSCVLWVDGQNVLEAAGYLVRVEVSHREENGSIWLMRRSKAERITEKLQSDAPSIEALVQAEVGCRCLARMSDNKWYRAELLGQTRLFRTVRLVDFGSPGEAVELKKWWDKEKVEANLFKPFKEPAVVGNQFLVVRRDWSDGKVGAVFNMDMRRID